MIDAAETYMIKASDIDAIVEGLADDEIDSNGLSVLHEIR